MYSIRLGPEDRRLLDTLARMEDRSGAAWIRRRIREAGRSLAVDPDPVVKDVTG